MMTDQFQIYTNSQKALKLRADRITLYQGAQIIEACSSNQSVYYLFFYKHHYLTAVKAKKLRRYSFIASAFKYGMVSSAPHPFIDTLLSENAPCRITGFDPLLQKLDKHYTPQEKAFILTFFESFISKKRLFNEILSVFYGYRRKGQMFLGYRIIRILMDFAPDHSLVRELSNDRQFRKYADLYSAKADKLLSDDLIFAEKVFYAERNHYFSRLINLLDTQSRWMDMTDLYREALIGTASDEHYQALKAMLDTYLTTEQRTYILEDLYRFLPHYPPLKQDLLTAFIEAADIVNILHLYNDPDLTLNKQQAQAISDLLEKLDVNTASLTPTSLRTLFELTLQLNPKAAQQLIHDDVSMLLNTHGPCDVKELLEPFYDRPAVHPIYQKIDYLLIHQDDLDHMQVLGELYYEFGQSEQAIDCFSWETELKPDDPKPPKWLAKVYRALDMTQESEAYEQLSVNLQKRV
ncbi:hypothetical protein GCM10028778_13380 [Barrientosiimonas marina]|uniref:Tetratricopeptide repeat protein n=1 Tax=Lentibacillus kimchii TaxID=1542911 RepID=A0ABW2UUS9_9BACI